MAVAGKAGLISDELTALCEELGRRAVDAGFRVATGGRGGVMAAVSRGAHSSPRYREGDVVGVLPGYGADDANEWVDVVIPTGIGFARNMVLVSSGDVVVAVNGGAGTLSEIALAWQIGKPVVALRAGGWAEQLADRVLDDRQDEAIAGASSAAEAVQLALAAIGAATS